MIFVLPLTYCFSFNKDNLIHLDTNEKPLPTYHVYFEIIQHVSFMYDIKCLHLCNNPMIYLVKNQLPVNFTG